MRILVTRPKEDAIDFTKALQALGHTPVLEPLLTIRYREDALLPPMAHYQALVFTSANGVRAFTRITQERTRPVFAVGTATAECARRAGFSHVEASGGDMVKLAKTIASRLDQSNGPLFHSAGSVRAGDLSALLSEHGFKVDRTVLYDAVPAKTFSLPADTIRQLDGAAFFSPRTALIFKELIGYAGLSQAMTNLSAYCLSQAVADNLALLPLKSIHVAAEPKQDALLKLLSE